jgi:hypothetical protein
MSMTVGNEATQKFHVRILLNARQSMPRRMQAVNDANRGHTKYLLMISYKNQLYVQFYQKNELMQGCCVCFCAYGIYLFIYFIFSSLPPGLPKPPRAIHGPPLESRAP